MWRVGCWTLKRALYSTFFAVGGGFSCLVRLLDQERETFSNDDLKGPRTFVAAVKAISGTARISTENRSVLDAQVPVDCLRSSCSTLKGTQPFVQSWYSQALLQEHVMVLSTEPADRQAAIAAGAVPALCSALAQEPQAQPSLDVIAALQSLVVADTSGGPCAAQTAARHRCTCAGRCQLHHADDQRLLQVPLQAMEPPSCSRRAALICW